MSFELKNFYSKPLLDRLKPAIKNAWMHETRLPHDNTRMPWMPVPAIRAGYPIAILSTKVENTNTVQYYSEGDIYTNEY